MKPPAFPAAPKFGEELLVWLQQIIAYFADLVNKILFWIQDIISKIASFIVSIVQSLYNALAKFFTDLGNFLTTLINGLKSIFDAILDQIGKAFEAVWNKILEVSIGVLDKIRAFIENIYSTLRILAANVIDAVTQWIKGVTNTIADFVSKVVDFVAGIVDKVSGSISGVVKTVIDAIEALFLAVAGKVVALYEQLITGATSIIASVESRLSQLKDAFADAALDAVKGLSDIAEEQVAPIRDVLKKAMEPLAAALSADDLKQLFDGYNALTAPRTLALQNREDARVLVDRLQSDTPVGRKLFLWAFNLASALAIYSGITSANAQVILQEFALVYPYQLMVPSDLVSLWRRNPDRKAGIILELRKQGYDETRAQDILTASSQVPSTGDLLEMMRRDPTLDAEVTRALTVQGIDEPWQSRVKALAQVLPSVQDLIVMAVREVFSPEVAQTFGQFEGFPEAFAVHAKRLGLSEEWARNYWAAHWSLPSASQGFEMMQRAVISPAELEILLRALDVMPFWRERLTKIAFLPYTRVDIRRMHQLGILSDDEVLRAHKDLGYDDEKALNLTRFVVALNKHKPSEDDEELGRLSRVQVLNFYGDGIIPRDRALGLLVGLGFTPEAAQLLIAATDLDQQRQHRKAETDLIIELAEAGTITFEEAQDRLDKLGLVPVEKERALTELLRSEQRKVRLPSRDDGDKFFRAGLIKAEEYLELLGRLGYSKRWADAYLKLLTTPKAK